MTAEGLLVSFLVKDNQGVSPGHRFPQGGIIARHRREENTIINPPTGFFPSSWIIEAIRVQASVIETAVNNYLEIIFIFKNKFYNLFLKCS